MERASLLNRLRRLTLSDLFTPIMNTIDVRGTLNSYTQLGLQDLSLFLTSNSRVRSPSERTSTFEFTWNVVLNERRPINGLLLLFL